ncbi:MAG TPA: TolC family protein [Gammaproteobacteria bacterium]|nr:TolC family protein [Gammaproteobacteria bacterium]
MVSDSLTATAANACVLKSTGRRGVISVPTLVFLLVVTLPVMGVAAEWDPLGTKTYVGLSPASAPDSRVPAYACAPASTVYATLDLMQVANISLCNNPQTQAAWINTKIAAAQLGISRGAYLPTLGLSVAQQRNHANPNPLGGSPNTESETNVSLTLQYLLLDFGGRGAQAESDKQALFAADFSQDADIQSVLFAAIQDYYDLLATQEAVTADKESVRSNQAAYDAAVARHNAGTATIADVLQAKTALSQALLTLTQTQGALTTAHGTLANVMGLPADTSFSIQPVSSEPMNMKDDANLKDLIASAIAARPDLAAAQAAIKSAQASVIVAQSAGLPTLSLFATSQYIHSTAAGTEHDTVYGLNLSVPLFSGFTTTYQVHLAKAELESAITQSEQIQNQVSLDVFQAYTALITAENALEAAEDLLKSAQASAQVAIGRYKAGVGDILDVLSANAALVSAQEQEIQNRYNLYIARTSLAKAIGSLDVGNLGSRPLSSGGQ